MDWVRAARARHQSVALTAAIIANFAERSTSEGASLMVWVVIRMTTRSVDLDVSLIAHWALALPVELINHVHVLGDVIGA